MGKISFLPFVKENLNRQLEAESEMLLIFENGCARRLSKISGMLDGLQHSSAQDLSRMSKKTKMYFINEKLNWPSEAGTKQYRRRVSLAIFLFICVQNVLALRFSMGLPSVATGSDPGYYAAEKIFQ
jgi:hypothetical protein